jgi:hypothetical protein
METKGYQNVENLEYGKNEEKTFLPEEKYYIVCPYQLFNFSACW